jgi:hypothetical protein
MKSGIFHLRKLCIALAATSNKKLRNHYGIRLEDVSTNYEHLSVTRKLNRNLLNRNSVYHMQMPSPTRRRKRAHQQLLTRSMEVSNLPYCAGWVLRFVHTDLLF